jgi:phosphonopyruvate decarboxylase
MINPNSFFEELCERGIDFFAGVPDSLLSGLCAAIQKNCEGSNKHVITANEGNAVALAAGYYLATGKPGLVYLQNSGLGNTINPLTSLADPEVYRIPMLLVIGWRAEPGVKDEPQHVKQGRISEDQLKLLEIPYRRLSAESDAHTQLNELFKIIEKEQRPVALLVHKETFEDFKLPKRILQGPVPTLLRENAIEVILDTINDDALVISTTGKTSREVYECRLRRNENQRDFLTVGSMGHTLSIALGVALGAPQKKIVCLDGDGSVLMHMGALPVSAALKPTNLCHIMLNNAAHESVGGQPTIADRVDFRSLVLACGYEQYFVADSEESLRNALTSVRSLNGPIFLEVKIAVGSRKDLGRPKSTPEQNKKAFVSAIGRQL